MHRHLLTPSRQPVRAHGHLPRHRLAMLGRRTLRLNDEQGQTTVLTIGLTAIVVALLVVMLAVTTVTTQARRLQALADGAARAGAVEAIGAVDEERLDLDPAEVDHAVATYLTDVDAIGFLPGLGGVEARVLDDGASTVEVHLRAEVSLMPPGGAFADTVPLSVPISATGDARPTVRR